MAKRQRSPIGLPRKSTVRSRGGRPARPTAEAEPSRDRPISEDEALRIIRTRRELLESLVGPQGTEILIREHHVALDLGLAAPASYAGPEKIGFRRADEEWRELLDERTVRFFWDGPLYQPPRRPLTRVVGYLQAAQELGPDVNSVSAALNHASLSDAPDRGQRLADVVSILRFLSCAESSEEWRRIREMAKCARAKPVIAGRAAAVSLVAEVLTSLRAGETTSSEVAKAVQWQLLFVRAEPGFGYREYDEPFVHELLEQAVENKWEAPYVTAALSIRAGAFGDAAEENEPLHEARRRIAKLFQHGKNRGGA